MLFAFDVKFKFNCDLILKLKYDLIWAYDLNSIVLLVVSNVINIHVYMPTSNLNRLVQVNGRFAVHHQFVRGTYCILAVYKNTVCKNMVFISNA